MAGLQTPGKTYLARPDNIARYTGGRFTAAGLATSAPPVAGPLLPKPRQLPASGPVPAGRVGLLIAEDDLEPETLPLGTARVAAVASLGAKHDRDEKVECFIGDALGDARDRAATFFGSQAIALPDASAAAVHNWAQAHQLDTLIVGDAPVGPGAMLLETIGRELAANGTMLHRIRRKWDSEAWPHAQRGFFAFHERVAGLI